MELAIQTYAIKIFLTLFIVILIPIYKKNYGMANFLWLSDVGLFLTVLAFWFNSSLLISMAVIGILPVEIIWMIDFFYQLFTRRTCFGISDYMFDAKYTKFLRSLSLFHIFVPVIWIVYLVVWGYNAQAVIYQTLLVWMVLTICYFFTDPKENINWVFLPNAWHWQAISGLMWWWIMMIGFPLLIILPSHLLLSFILNK